MKVSNASILYIILLLWGAMVFAVMSIVAVNSAGYIGFGGGIVFSLIWIVGAIKLGLSKRGMKGYMLHRFFIGINVFFIAFASLLGIFLFIAR